MKKYRLVTLYTQGYKRVYCVIREAAGQSDIIFKTADRKRAEQFLSARQLFV